MESELSEVAPSEWQRLPIEAVCKLVTSGGTPSRRRPEFYIGGKWGWVKTQELKDSWIDRTEENITDEAIASSSARVLPSKTVLLALYGATAGQLGILRHEMTCNQACCAMIVDPSKADYRFLFYQLLVSRFQLKRLATGAAQQNLSGQLIKSYKLPFPPLREQRAIACILGSLDDKIELNRRMNRTLEEMARAIFKSWFIDFDPVRAKAAVRREHPNWTDDQVSRAACPKLKPEIARLFPDSFENSELGEIPRGWEVGTFGDVAEHQRRGVQPERIEANTPYIALEHMPRHSITLSEWSAADGLESNKFRFKKGEILFGKLRPYFHKVGVAPVDGVCSTDIVVLTPRQPGWFGFVLGHACSVEFIEYTNAGSTGTKMPRTTWAYMACYKLALPPEPVAAVLTKVIQPLVDRIVVRIHESRTLAVLRDALLPKLVSGELRIPDAERIAARKV